MSVAVEVGVRRQVGEIQGLFLPVGVFSGQGQELDGTAIKFRFENTGLKGLISSFRYNAFEDEKVLNKIKRERITSRLAGIINADLMKDKFFRNKLEEERNKLPDKKLIKEIINIYKEGWGINDEADAYLIRKLLDIDIIIYKVLDSI